MKVVSLKMSVVKSKDEGVRDCDDDDDVVVVVDDDDDAARMRMGK